MAVFQRKLSAVNSIFALFADPYGTAKHLLTERGKPPYLMTMIISLVAIVVAPPLAYQRSTGMRPQDPVFGVALSLTILLVTVLFVATATVFLRLLRARVSPKLVFASCIYSLCPVMPIALGFYATSFYLDGNWSFLQFLATGLARSDSRSTSLLSAVAPVTMLYSTNVLLNCIRVLIKGTPATSLFITLFFLVLLASSYLTALAVTGNFFPGYPDEITRFLKALSGM